MNRYIRIDENKKVTSVRYGTSIVEGEIKSDIGELGQIMQSDGTFITPPQAEVPQIHEPSNAELAQMISALQADLMIAGVI